MLVWWFKHIEGTLEVEGRTYPRYLFWHPLELYSLHHRFTFEGDVTQYDSAMLIGAAGRLGRLVNPIIRRRVFGERHAHAWIKHNIEEVGLFEHILPAVYPNDAQPARH